MNEGDSCIEILMVFSYFQPPSYRKLLEENKQLIRENKGMVKDLVSERFLHIQFVLSVEGNHNYFFVPHFETLRFF